MYTEKELKNIKISIKRQIPIDDNANEETTDYSFSNDEKLLIHIRPSEGTKPLFDDELANKTSSTIPDQYPSRISNRSDVEVVFNKLEDILGDLEEKTKHAERDVKRAKRSRSRNTSYSESSRSNSINPRKKRMRKSDSEHSNPHKYGHSSKFNIDNDIANKRKNRYRDTSRSSSSDRSYSSYLSRKLEKDMSCLLSDSVLSNRSRRSDNKNSRNSKKYDVKYRQSSRKSERRHENYNDHDYYRHDLYYQNMKERYARYYTVMYAFNIIMDILRKDDLYNNHY